MEVLLRNEENEPIYPKTRAGLVTRPGGGDVEAALEALEGGRGLRPLFEAAGAKYNEATGFYELNGLTDITEAEMVEIYVQTGTFGCGDNYPGVAAGTNIGMETLRIFRARSGIARDWRSASLRTMTTLISKCPISLQSSNLPLLCDR